MSLTDLIPWNRNRSATVPVGEERDALLTLHREMNRVFDEVTSGFGMPVLGRRNWPSVDVSETETEVKVTAELPGLSERDVEVSLRDGVLQIKGEKRAESDGTFYTERWHGQFQRTIQIGPLVDPDKVSASFRNGVLTVSLAKRPDAQAQVRRIPIAAA